MDQSVPIIVALSFFIGLPLAVYFLYKWLENCSLNNAKLSSQALLSSVELAEPTEYHTPQKNVDYHYQLCEKLNHHPNQRLDQAIDLATKAVEEDKNGNYENAIKLYDDSVAIFTQLANDGLISEKVKNGVGVKCTLYSDRTKDLRDYLNSNESTRLLLPAIYSVTQATEEDKNQNYREATRLYDEGMTIFSILMESVDVSQALKDKIREKCEQYGDRVNKLKKCFEKKENEASSLIESGNESAVEATKLGQNGVYLAALHYYEDACEYFSDAMSITDLSQETVNSARSKYDECNEKVVNFTKYLLENPTLTSLERLNDVMQKAIEEDKKHNYAEAQRMYSEGFGIWSYLRRDDLPKLTFDTKYLQYHKAVGEQICKNFGERFLDKYHRDTFKLFHIRNVTVKAFEEDDNDNDEEAIKLYRNGIEYFSKLLDDETLPKKTKDAMRERCEEFKERVEYLEDFLKE